MFKIERIPDQHLLYYRIHKNDIKNGDIIPGAFRERGEGGKKGMSTDWAQYSTPEQSRARARRPEDNAIVQFVTGCLRNVNLTVTHAPEIDNRAHTNVRGIDTETRVKLLDLFEWAIRYKTPSNK